MQYYYSNYIENNNINYIINILQSLGIIYFKSKSNIFNLPREKMDGLAGKIGTKDIMLYNKTSYEIPNNELTNYLQINNKIANNVFISKKEK